MQRVVVLGRGGSGKSTLARELGAATGLPVVELDKVFWSSQLTPLTPDAWAAVQDDLVRRPAWIADGDLGPYDVLEVRLAADTVIVLDIGLLRCAWRAVRRSRERLDFWLWVVSYRRRWLPVILDAIRTAAPHADVRVLQSPRAVELYLSGVEKGQ